MAYTPSQANQNKFLQNFMSTVKAKLLPSKPSVYNQQTTALNRIQTKINPYINQTNKNASMIHNYITSNSYPNVGNNVIGGGAISSIPQSSVAPYISQNYSQPVDTSADYLPIIQHLSDMIRQKSIGSPLPSVDLSPYLAHADNIRMAREAMG